MGIEKNGRQLGVVLAILIGALAAPATAQSSASFQLEETVFNAGGHPNGGTTMASAAFHVTLDSLGDAIHGTPATSASYALDLGIVPTYAVPANVANLAFDSKDTMDWDGQPAAVAYHLYRQESGMLPGPYAGGCNQPDLAASAAAVPGAPPSGNVWFYLATAENRLGEEGTRGFESSGSERPDVGACP